MMNTKATVFFVAFFWVCVGLHADPYSRPNRKKYAADHRAEHRAKLLQETHAKLENQGITINEDYEHRRKAINVVGGNRNRKRKARQTNVRRQLHEQLEELKLDDRMNWARFALAQMSLPTTAPTDAAAPVEGPTASTIFSPTSEPTQEEATEPFFPPTASPVANPTSTPTPAPVVVPSPPTPAPTRTEVSEPTLSPIDAQTSTPTASSTDLVSEPTLPPIDAQTPTPTASFTNLLSEPTLPPIDAQTPTPTASFTNLLSEPTLPPIDAQTPTPTASSTDLPVLDPVPAPVVAPTSPPTASSVTAPVSSATSSPTLSPTALPVAAPVLPPTPPPTSSPTAAPVPGPPPPTVSPTSFPTGAPVTMPVPAPVPAPTASPTIAPIPAPLPAPVSPPTSSPTQAPVPAPTSQPTLAPVPVPVADPTSAPTIGSTTSPTLMPVMATDPPASGVRQIIEPVALFGGAEFDDPASYQSCALDWLESSETAALSDDRIIQRYALASIYCATNAVRTEFTDEALGGGIVPWSRSRGWLTNEEECTWANIACNADGRVEILDLFGNLLTGEFPPEIVYLKESLRILDMGQNFVFTIADEFNSYLGQLTGLTELRYENTNFISDSGIPTEIGNLKNLEFYNCANVRYAGALNGAAFPSDLTRLTYMEVEFNSYNSSIPTAIGALPSLQFFYIRDSFVRGSLDFMRNMPAIIELWVDMNPGLRGPLPDFIGSLNSLASFSVTSNDMTGTLPASIGDLGGSLTQLFLYDNDFTGTVPETWGALGSLRRLEMELNLLTGLIPESICFNTFATLTALSADCPICPTLGFACCDTCFDEFGNEITPPV